MNLKLWIITYDSSVEFSTHFFASRIRGVIESYVPSFFHIVISKKLGTTRHFKKFKTWSTLKKWWDFLKNSKFKIMIKNESKCPFKSWTSWLLVWQAFRLKVNSIITFQRSKQFVLYIEGQWVKKFRLQVSPDLYHIGLHVLWLILRYFDPLITKIAFRKSEN